MTNETQQILLMIDNNQTLLETILDAIRRRVIVYIPDMEDYVAGFFSDAYIPEPGTDNPFWKITEGYVTTLVDCALKRVDYKVVFDHYKQKIAKGC